MRIEYVDKLKGFAILTVVLGHVVEKSMGITEGPFVFFYTSFHMPLFMFLSGMFAIKVIAESSTKDFFNTILKKFRRIMVPFLFWGVLFTTLFLKDPIAIFNAKCTNFWFLPALFYCMLVVVAVNFLLHVLYSKYNSNTLINKQILFVGGVIFVYVILCVMYIKGVTIPYGLRFIKNFPFFLLGILYTHSPKLQNALLQNNVVYFVCSIVYLSLLYFTMPPILTGTFAIIILVNLFNTYSNNIPSILSILGKYTLEIYVLHWFILPKLIFLGDYYKEICESTANMNYVVLITASFVLAAIIIFFCILGSMIVKRNPYLQKITGF